MTKKEVERLIATSDFDIEIHGPYTRNNVLPPHKERRMLVQLLETMNERDRVQEKLDDLLIGGGVL